MPKSSERIAAWLSELEAKCGRDKAAAIALVAYGYPQFTPAEQDQIAAFVLDLNHDQLRALWKDIDAHLDEVPLPKGVE